MDLFFICVTVLWFFFFCGISVKGIFQSVNQSFWEHFTQNNSGWVLFFFSDAECRLFIRNLLDSLGANERENLWVFKWKVLFFWRVSVKEWIQWFGMPMNVQDQRNRCASIDLIQKFLNLVNFRLGLLSGYSPNSIDIKPAKICPVMSVLDSIDVDHGKDEEKVIFFNLI